MKQSDESKGTTPSAPEPECSTCRQLRAEGPDELRFVVAPADGGGWQPWSAALLRLLERIGHQPTQVMIISQPLLNDRYVQTLIGHGFAYAEVGSNVFLTGKSRLSADHEELLTLLGWLSPDSDTDTGPDAPGEMLANWRLPLVDGDWLSLVEMFVGTMVGILGFAEQLPVEVRSFGAENPCRECSWPAATASKTP